MLRSVFDERLRDAVTLFGSVLILDLFGSVRILDLFGSLFGCLRLSSELDSNLYLYVLCGGECSMRGFEMLSLYSAPFCSVLFHSVPFCSVRLRSDLGSLRISLRMSSALFGTRQHMKYTFMSYAEECVR